MDHTPAAARPADTNPPPLVSPSAPLAELRIAVQPGHGTIWHGSRAQLEAAGITPPDGLWPQGGEVRVWHTDPWSYLLCRCRPAKFKGPMRLWLEGDHWMCRRRPAPQAAGPAPG